ncbi:MAG: MlaD family protein [Solirubrobacteraceae bacterium]|nr:MlaD family protein [Solirubrobacteraceae bacterium]
MTPSRIAAIAAIFLGVCALAFVSLRGGDADRYSLVFDDAGGLIPGNLLKVNGLTVGTIKDIDITKDLKARVDIELTELGPLRKGTLAQIRATSLGGVANKYIALSLGANNAPAIPDGTVLGEDSTRGITGQDELVNAFDEKTREGLQKFVKGNADAVKGNSEALQKVLTNAPGTLEEGKLFVKGLNPDENSLRDIIVNAAAINSALKDRTESISHLSVAAAQASQAAAGNGTEIAETLAGAPDVADQATQVLTDLPETLDQVQRLIVELDKNKAGLPATLTKLSDTLDSGESTISALARSLNKSGKNNDIADLLDSAPAVGKAAEGAAKSVPGGLAAATPLLGEARAYTPDIVAAIEGLGLISANYDAAGHYARLSPVFNLFSLNGTAPNQDLIPRSDFNNRLQGFTTVKNRCPGSAAQATSDGSAPFTDGGKVSCTASDVPPGP